MWESLYITPGGLGTGLASAAAFVSMTTLLQGQDVAMATSGYMLLVSLAMTTGVTFTNTVLGLGFKLQLQRHLRGEESAEVSCLLSEPLRFANSTRSSTVQPQTQTSLLASTEKFARL